MLLELALQSLAFQSGHVQLCNGVFEQNAVSATPQSGILGEFDVLELCAEEEHESCPGQQTQVLEVLLMVFSKLTIQHLLCNDGWQIDYRLFCR